LPALPPVPDLCREPIESPGPDGLEIRVPLRIVPADCGGVVARIPATSISPKESVCLVICWTLH
jgi:hypothetical protein